MENADTIMQNTMKANLRLCSPKTMETTRLNVFTGSLAVVLPPDILGILGIIITSPCLCLIQVAIGLIAGKQLFMCTGIGDAAIIHHEQNRKFLAYYFQTNHFFDQKRRLAHGTKVIEVSPEALKRIRIPVPPLEEQERIVGILDKFEALCGDLSRGLPGELALRRKQFAYYRERLLDFQEQVG